MSSFSRAASGTSSALPSDARLVAVLAAAATAVGAVAAARLYSRAAAIDASALKLSRLLPTKGAKPRCLDRDSLLTVCAEGLELARAAAAGVVAAEEQEAAAAAAYAQMGKSAPAPIPLSVKFDTLLRRRTEALYTKYGITEADVMHSLDAFLSRGDVAVAEAEAAILATSPLHGLTEAHIRDALVATMDKERQVWAMCAAKVEGAGLPPGTPTYSATVRRLVQQVTGNQDDASREALQACGAQWTETRTKLWSSILRTFAQNNPAIATLAGKLVRANAAYVEHELQVLGGITGEE